MNQKITSSNLLTMYLEDLIMHGLIVSNLATSISKKLNMSDEFIENIGQAGLLYDIGKLRISDYLYGRNRRELKVEELKFVRMHSILSYGILKKRGYNSEILDAVLYHHENYDGSGYPNNLKGDDIPVAARILRICDVFSALVANRPYREAYTVDGAVRQMIAEVNNFDMKYFLIFLGVINSPNFEKIVKLIEENKKNSIITYELKKTYKGDL